MDVAFFFLCIAGRKSGRTERGVAMGEKVGVGSKERERIESFIESVSHPLVM